MAAATTDDAFLLADCEALPDHVRRRAAFRVVRGRAARCARTRRGRTRPPVAARRRPTAAPVRLTRRGVVVLAAAVAVVAAVLVGLAWLSAPAAAAGGAAAGCHRRARCRWRRATRCGRSPDGSHPTPTRAPRSRCCSGSTTSRRARPLQPGDVLRVH